MQGYKPCSRPRISAGPPAASAPPAPAAPPPPGGCRRSRPEAIGVVVGDDPHYACAAFDHCADKRSSQCDIDTFEQVGAPGLLPVGTREVAERQHVFTGLQPEIDCPGEALRQGAGQALPAGLDLSGLLLGAHRTQRGGDHTLVGYSFGEGFAYGDALQQVPGELNPAQAAQCSAPPGATLAAALQHPPDPVGETAVGIADHELDPRKAALYCFAEACGYE